MVVPVFLKKIARILGVDKSIAYSSTARIVQAVSSIITIFFLSVFLSKEEQGYYFTFSSLVGIQVFFELGMSGIITQFVAYEASHLIVNNRYEIEGDIYYKSRLASLLHFCFKWYLIIALLLFVILILIGYVFFYRFEQTSVVEWQLPWLIICFSTVIKFFQSPFNSYIMGLGMVKEMSKISFIQQLILPLTLWIGLWGGFKLYMVGLSTFISVIIWNFYIHNSQISKILISIWKIPIDNRVDYIKEIFPFQWRIACSSLSGYFIFQFMNPMLFAFQGAVIAGQMGLTLSALSGVQALSMSWLNTKVPLYSSLIALKQYSKLDELFNLTLRQMVFVCIALMICLFIFIELLGYFKFQIDGNIVYERFLSGGVLLIMIGAYVIDQFTFSWGSYLRCHKKEPFLTMSVVTGFLCFLSIYFISKYSTVFYVSMGYFLVKLINIPWGYSIFKNKRKLWHNI